MYVLLWRQNIFTAVRILCFPSIPVIMILLYWNAMELESELFEIEFVLSVAYI